MLLVIFFGSQLVSIGLVVGETQITGQFKDALQIATATKCLGPTLGRLGQVALGTAKKVRSQTAIGEKHVSISHAAIDLATTVFDNLTEHTFLLIGAGEMSQIAARHIKNYHPKALFVANRTLSRASELTKDVGIGTAHSLEELPELLIDADIVISSTAAPNLVIGAADLKAVQRRRSRPLFLVDIALPRDIDPNCGDLDDVYLFDIDDLQQVVDRNKSARRAAAEQGLAFVEQSLSTFKTWLAQEDSRPVLREFRIYLENLAEREMAKTMGRNELAKLAPQERQAMEKMVKSIVNKVCSDVGRQSKNPPVGFYQDSLLQAIQALFLPGDR